MVNPHAGEVAVSIDGQVFAARLTLGALAALEAELGEDSMFALIRRFEEGAFRSRDVLAVIAAGLHGAGWRGNRDDLAQADLCASPVGAARAAAQLLVRAFGPAA